MAAPAPQNDPAKRRRIVIFGLIMGALSLFMYVSIIAKTATMGP